MNDKFVLQIMALLDKKGIETDFEKLKQEFKKHGIEIDPVINLSKTKSEIQKFAKEIAPQLKEIFSNAGIEVNIKDIESAIKTVYKNVSNEVDSFYKKNMNAIDLEIKQREENAKIFSNQIKTQMQERIAAENKIQAELKKTAKDQQDALNLKSGKIQLDNQISAYLNENTKLSDELKNKLIQIRTQIKTVDNTGLKQLRNEFKEITTEAKALGQTGRSVLSELGNNIQKFSQWYGIAGVVTSSVRAVKNLVNTVSELDKSYVDLQMATGGTIEETQRLLNTYIELGQELGATGTEVANAADVWLRQGKSIAETNMLIRDSMILSKIGQVDSAKATEYLTSAMKGYKVEAEDVLGIIDKLSAVDLNSATSVGGLAEAMSRTANGARIAGIEIDKLLGMLAVVGETSQRSMDSVGESFKSIFSRMGNVKAGKFIDENGKDITGEINDVEKVLGKLNIKLRENAKEFRNFGNVLDEVGNRWSEFSEIEQNAIATAFAGTYQRESFITLMENYAKSLEYADVAANSAGTAMEKFATYEESVEAKTKILQASLQKLAVDTLNSNVIKSFLDFANVLINITDKIGLLNVASVALFGYIGTKTGIFKTLADQISLAMVAQAGYTVETTAAAFAQVGLTGAIKATTMALKSFLLSNPLGWVLLGTTAVIALTKAYDELNVTLEEQQEITTKLKEEYDSIQSELTTLNKELQTTIDRMTELESKKFPSLADKSELETLKETNEELRTRINLLRLQEEESQRKLSESLLKEFEKDLNDRVEKKSLYNTTTVYGGGREYEIATNISEAEYAQELLRRYDELNKKKAQGIELSKYENIELKNAKSELIEIGNKYADYAKKAKEYGVEESIRKGWMDVATQINKTLDPYSYKQLSFEDVFNADSFAETKGKLLELAKAGELSTDTLSSNKEYQELLLNTELTAEEVVNQIYSLANSIENATNTGINSGSRLLNILDANKESLDDYQESLKKIQTTLKSNDLSSSEIVDLMQEFSNFDWESYGVTGEKGVGNLNAALNGLAKELKDNIEQITGYNKAIQSMYEEAITASIGVEDLSLVTDAVNKKTKLSSEQIKYLTERYSGLSKYLVEVKGGWYLEEEAINTVNTAITDLKLAYINAQTEMSSIIQTESYKRLSAIGIELTSIGTLYEFYQALSSTPGASNISWQDIQNVQKYYELLEIAKNALSTPPETKTGSGYDKEFSKSIDWATQSIQNLQTAVDNAQDKLSDTIGYDKQTKAVKNLISAQEALKKGYQSAADSYKKQYDKIGGIDKYKKLIESGATFTSSDFTDENLYNEIVKAQDLWNVYQSMLTKAKDVAQDIADINDKILSDAKKSQEEIIKSQFDTLEYEHDMGLKTDQQYWDEKLALAEKYYTENGKVLDEYLDEYRDIEIGYYQWTVKQAEEATKKQEEIAEKLKDKYTDLINDIANEIKDEKDRVLDELEEAHEAEIDRLKEQKDAYKEIIETQLDLLDAKRKQNDYEKSIAKQTKEISKLESRKAELEKAAQSGDRTAIAELAKLNEELAKKKEDLADDQADHEYDLQKEALNKALDANNKLFDAKIDSENEKYKIQKSNIEKLYDQEIELIKKAAQYTEQEFDRVLDDIVAKLSNVGVKQSSSYIDSIKQSQSGIADTDLPVSTSTRAAILAILRNGKGKDYGEEASALAAYTRDNYGAPISKAQAVEIAKLLGVEGINSVSDLTGNDANKNKILEALRKAGFSKGGYVNLDTNTIHGLGEHGIALVRRKELVLNEGQSKLFKELMNNIKPLNNLVKLTSPIVSNLTTNNSPTFKFDNMIQINGTVTGKDASTQIKSAGDDIIKKIMDVVRVK